MARTQDEIYIVGAGSIGCYLAARLGQGGHECRIVARDAERAALISENGLTLVGTEKGQVPMQAIAWSGIEKFPSGAQIWVTPKLYQLKDTLREISRRVDGSQLVVLFQNGLGVLDGALERVANVPKAQWVRAICWFGARLQPPTTVLAAGGSDVELGGESKPAVDRVAKALEKGAKLEITHRGTVNEVEWRKALWNVSMNGVCAIADAPNGAAVADPYLRPMIERVLEEAAEVARREGVEVTQGDLDRVFAAARATATNYNSTWQDLRAGRHTEMPWLNGAVVHRAAAHGIQVPANEMVHQMVQYLERTLARRVVEPAKAPRPVDSRQS